MSVLTVVGPYTVQFREWKSERERAGVTGHEATARQRLLHHLYHCFCIVCSTYQVQLLHVPKRREQGTGIAGEVDAVTGAVEVLQVQRCADTLQSPLRHNANPVAKEVRLCG